MIISARMVLARVGILLALMLGTVCVSVTVARFATWGYPSLEDVNYGLALIHLFVCLTAGVSVIFGAALLWAWNPSFTIGRKNRLPKAQVVK